MKSDNLTASYGKYLLARDKKGAFSILLLSAIAVTIWWLTGHNLIFGGIVLAFILSMAVLSFCLYLFMGKIRIVREEAFYDSIYYECGLPSQYEGRRMKALKFVWKGLSISPLRIDIHTGPSAPLAQDGKAWRKVKTAAIEVFDFTKGPTTAHIDNLRKGFMSIACIQMPGVEELEVFKAEKYLEELNGLAYEELSTMNYALPKLELSDFVYDGNDHSFSSLKVQTENHLDAYEVERFYAKFAARYSGDFIWSVSHGPNHIELTKIAKGSDEERKIQTLGSLSGLINGTVRNAYMSATSDHIRVVPQSVKWSDTGYVLQGFRVDFGPTDLTDQEQIKSFEDYLKTGLKTIFQHAGWSLKWTVSGYERYLDVSMVPVEESPAEAVSAPSAPPETLPASAIIPAEQETLETQPMPERVKGDDEIANQELPKKPLPSLPVMPKSGSIPKMPVRPKPLPPRPKFD